MVSTSDIRQTTTKKIQAIPTIEQLATGIAISPNSITSNALISKLQQQKITYMKTIIPSATSDNNPVAAALCNAKCYLVSLFLLMILMQGVAWGQAGPLRLMGSGGTVTEINVSGTFYKVHTYTTTGSSTFTPPSGASSVEYMVVAGGGGGGNSTDRTGGGGGAGGVLNGLSYAVTVQGYTVTVGAGGATNTAGNNSVFGTLTAIGGGRGGQSTNMASSGGSGGGAYHNNSDSGKAGTAGQGTVGGNGYDSGSQQFAAGGGGGQSQPGATGVNGQAGKGGNGYTSSISGSSLVYAGGGGGGYQHLSGSGNAGAGGTGGGGAGGSSTGTAFQNGTAGTANTGGGGGGAGGTASGVGGAGGSGIVIIRYKAPTLAITTQPSTSICNGQNFSQLPVIRLLDGDGVAVSGVTVTTAIKTGTGGSLNNITASTDASGYAAFTNLQITGISGNSYTLKFTVSGSTQEVISNTITFYATPTASATKNDITCFDANNGQIVVTGTNGTAPYTYSIYNGVAHSPYPDYQSGSTFTGLGPGQYKIRVIDSNGCESVSIP